MAKILNWLSVQKKLKEKNILIFTPSDISRLFGASKTAINFFVHRNTKKGLLVRFKKSRKGSLYALSDNMPDEYLTANRLHAPSYVSLDTALSFHGIIPETIYAVTSVTTMTTRKFEAAGISYRYSRVKKSVYTGYKPIKYKNNTIFMAEPEKALADYLYFVDLKKRGFHYDRIEIKHINRRRLIKFIKLFSRPGMLKLADKIYADRTKHQRIY